ncbi:MAG TPA: nucleotidyltransferase domain-containing protein [Candidatus Omnitrophota bacterium]|nr:nucleotidyltransferase domain-containing protein [Candidatus Omnitrophota bacterium]
MQLNRPLDKILNNEVKVRALRIFCQNAGEMSGRQIAKIVGVTPKTAHEILQDLLREGILIMQAVGKTYLFRLNEDRAIVQEALKPLFLLEKTLSEGLFDLIRGAIKKSALKDDILSVALFGSVQTKTERAASDVDLLVVVKTAEFKKKTEALFSEIDRQTSLKWGNLISPYVNSLAELKCNAKKKTGVIPRILKSYQLIYGERLEKLLR